MRSHPCFLPILLSLSSAPIRSLSLPAHPSYDQSDSLGVGVGNQRLISHVSYSCSLFHGNCAVSCSQCESCFSRSLKAKAPKATKFSGLGTSFSPVSAFGSDSYHATSLIISASTVYLRYPFSPQCVEIMYVSSLVKHSNFHVPPSNKEAPPLILT